MLTDEERKLVAEGKIEDAVKLVVLRMAITTEGARERIHTALKYGK